MGLVAWVGKGITKKVAKTFGLDKDKAEAVGHVTEVGLNFATRKGRRVRRKGKTMEVNDGIV
jgi:hypothetical protein